MKDRKQKHNTTEHTPFESGVGGLREKTKFPLLKSLVVLLVVSLVGGLLVWRSYAVSASTAGIINTYYQTVVCKSADSGGLAYWGGQYDAAKTTSAKNAVIANMVAQLQNTQTYKNLPGGKCPTTTSPSPATPATPAVPTTPAPNSTASCATANNSAGNTNIVKGYYKNILKVNEPDSEGLNYWVGQLNNCKKTPAEVEAYFKSKAPKPQAPYKPSKAFPTRTAGQSDNQYQSAVALWVSGEWNNITQNCCGGLNDSWGWAARIINKTWTVEQVLNHFSNTTGKNFQEQMKDPESDFARRFEINKKIKAAIMERIKAFIAGGGVLKNSHPLGASCEGNYKNYLEGYIDILAGPCFEGTGLNYGDQFMWTDKIMSGQVTLEEAIAAISAGQTPNLCSDAIELLSPSCNSGATWQSGTDLDGYYNGDWEKKLEEIREEMRENRVVPQPGEGGGGFSTVPTGNSNPANEVEAMSTKQSPYEHAITKANTVTAPSTAVTACTTKECVVVPVGKTKAADVKSGQNAPTVIIESPPSCGYENPTICNNQYTEEWNNGGAKESVVKPQVEASSFSAEDVKRCVDQYARLEPGDDSNCVKLARIYLGLAGYTNAVDDSSEYDVSMQDTVEEFQSDQDVSNSSGIVDRATWDKLKDVSGKAQQSKKLVAKDQQVVAEITNEIQRSSSAILLASCPEQRIIRQGSTGNCVRRIQQILALVHNSGLPITGKFDSVTQDALKEFQSDRGLKPTGVTDKETWAMLEASRQTDTYRSPFKAESGSVVNNRQ